MVEQNLTQALSSAVEVQSLLDEGEDPSFAAVGRQDGFFAMLDPERLVGRSSEFDRMILSRDAHSWSPLDSRYLDFGKTLDAAAEPLIEERAFACLEAPSVAQRLADPIDKVRFVNKIAWFRFSNLLHGEQGALNLSASLCGMLRHPGAQEFVANQTREEARHVAAFSSYIKAYWGRPAPALPALREFLREIIESNDVSKKIIGMQVMVEGLAMGSFGSLYRTLRDALGKRLIQLVMTDEAMHHKFGKLWASRTMPNLSPAERSRLESWTTHCLATFIVKMNPPFELQVLARDFGLDPMVVGNEIQQLSKTRVADTAFGIQEIFGVLTRTLLGAGLLSQESQATYQAFVSAGPTRCESDYDDIVDDGLAFLKSINHERDPDPFLKHEALP